MGFRLRGQLFILCFSLIGVSLVTLAYFNISAFRLSFFTDEEQWLKAKGLKVANDVRQKFIENKTDSQHFYTLSSVQQAFKSVNIRTTHGLSHLELWDKKGEIIFRSGNEPQQLIQKQRLLTQLHKDPVPTHFFLDTTTNSKDSDPPSYRYSLVGKRKPSERISTKYELLFPLFGRSHKVSSPDNVTANPKVLQAILHLSFDVENRTKRLSLVTAGNILIVLIFGITTLIACLLYTSPSPRDQRGSRMPSSA